jgi:hypothetical protein
MWIHGDKEHLLIHQRGYKHAKTPLPGTFKKIKDTKEEEAEVETIEEE